MDPCPIVFAEDRHEALWGYERWLVSAHPYAPSVVAAGPFAGRRLDELVREFGADLAGRRANGHFPILVKEIVARQRLSLQVHPNEHTAVTVGGEPKTEMWHVLDAEPGGMLWAGVKAGTTAESLSEAIAEGHAEELMERYAANVGDDMLIRGGLVHSLGGGVRVLEVQQSSNTTYRLYDWGRVDASGRPRPLQVREALAAADLALKPSIVRGGTECEFFRIFPVDLSEGMEMPADPDTFRVLFAEAGGFAVESKARRLEVPEGGAVLVPAVASVGIIPSDGSVRLLSMSLA